jgi:hypothetical protein
MTRKQKVVVFISTLLFALALALAGAIPYGYFMLALGAAGGGFIIALCWALYAFTAVTLWLAVWRTAVMIVRRWPGRRG